jgi:hypothetical protein
LKDGDRVVTSQEDKHEVLFDFHNNLLGTSRNRQASLDLQYFHRAGMDLSQLDSPITEEEVLATIKALPVDRRRDLMGSLAGSIRHVGVSSNLILWLLSSLCNREMIGG